MKRTMMTRRTTSSVRGLGMLLLCLAGVPALAAPTNWCVAIGYGQDYYPGTNWAQPFQSISNACAHVHSGDTIIVSNGLYNVTATITQSVANVTIAGYTGIASDVQVVADGHRSVLYVSGTNVTVQAMTFSSGTNYAVNFNAGPSTIRNCTISNSFGACNGASPHLMDSCLIVSNLAGGNQACHAPTGIATWTNCTFAFNAQGAIYELNNTVTALVTKCSFYTNSYATPLSQQGGNVCFINDVSASPAITITNCSFIGNMGTTLGLSVAAGGIFNCGFINNNGTSVGINTNSIVSACSFVNNTTVTKGSCLSGLNGCVISNCTFSGNSATTNTGYGGAVFFSSVAGLATPVFYGCVFSNNSAAAGGVFAADQVNSSAIFRNCLFIGNSATNGSGGINYSPFNAPDKWSFINCAMIGNQASGSGGALYFNAISSNNVLDSCTIAGNWCGTTNGGGGVYFGAMIGCYVTNSIIYSNLVGSGVSLTQDVYLAAFSTNYFQNCNLRLTNTDSRAVFSNCITNYPLFANAGTAGSPYGTNLLNGTYNFQLTRSSPCRDAGMNETNWMRGALDLLGNPRISGLTVDIGCYEYQIPPASGTAVFFH